MDQQQQQIHVPAPHSPATSSAPPAPSPSPPPPQAPATSITNTNPSSRPAILPPAIPPAAFSRPTISTAVASSRGGGNAIGDPAPRPSPPQQTGSFSPAYGYFGGLPREPSPLSSNASQVRPSMPGMGVLGSLGSGAQMRPSGLPATHQPRPVQPPMRPVSSPGTQLPSSQSYQGHGMLRMPTSGSSSSSLQSTPQTTHSLNQPWLASGPQGRPPMPTPSYRHPVTSPQPRSLSQPQLQSHQQQPQQQQVSSLQQQQALSSQQTHEQNSKQQALPPRAPQTITHLQQATRIQNSAATQQPSSSTTATTTTTPASGQPNAVLPGPYNRTITPAPAPPATETTAEESCNRMLRKRTIHELLHQVDPYEKFDPDVVEILMDYADEFIESITTFGCSLAKHRKSATLEAKDILLHLERNWNITLPGFTGDEIKCFRKPPLNDVHRERIAAIKKSVVTTEVTASRNPGGQATGAAKGVVKTPANVFGSPNVKN